MRKISLYPIGLVLLTSLSNAMMDSSDPLESEKSLSQNITDNLTNDTSHILNATNNMVDLVHLMSQLPPEDLQNFSIEKLFKLNLSSKDLYNIINLLTQVVSADPDNK